MGTQQAMSSVVVVVPKGAEPGSQIPVSVNGQVIQVIVPAGVAPGQEISVPIPEQAMAVAPRTTHAETGRSYAWTKTGKPLQDGALPTDFNGGLCDCFNDLESCLWCCPFWGFGALLWWPHLLWHRYVPVLRER